MKVKSNNKYSNINIFNNYCTRLRAQNAQSVPYAAPHDHAENATTNVIIFVYIALITTKGP